MHRILSSAAVLLAAASVAVAEPETPQSQPAQDGSCLIARSVNGFRVVDRQTLILTGGASRRFEAKLGAGCIDVDDPLEIAVVSRGVCVRAGDEIAYKVFGDMRRSCLIAGLRELPAGDQAEPEAQAP